MKRIVVALFGLGLAGVAVAETPPQALAKVPPLPKAASQDLDCSAAEAGRKKVEETVNAQMRAVQAAGYGGPMGSMTPAQVEAMGKLTEPDYNTCPIDVMQPEAQSWPNDAEAKLTAKMGQIEEALRAADAKWCETHTTGEMCEPNPGARQKAAADSAVAGSQFLKNVQPAYAKFQKLIADCLALRDKPLGSLRGLTGPMGNMVVGAEAQNWSLVGSAFDAQGKACGRAREAARRFVDQY
jgi:hypothetical protein